MKFLAVLFISAVMVAFGMRDVSAQTRVSNFGLKDQNDKYTEVNFPSDRPVILIFGDRKGAGQIGGWSEPLYRDHGEKVYIFGIASLGGVPSYARGLVRRLIKRQTSYPVLLDWGGKVAKSIEYEAGKAFVVVVSRDGSVKVKRSGPASESGLTAIKEELNKLL
jgi:hypothetical protein